MRLTYAQKKDFMENGFVKIPGVIPKSMIQQTVKMINHSLGSEGMNKEDLPKFRSLSYCPELQNAPMMADLIYKTPAVDLVQSIIGEGNLSDTRYAQIALRFPTMADSTGPIGYHLDGMHTKLNGVEEGTYSNFTMLFGVMLSDLPDENSGNLAVWPGSHRLYEKYFRKHGSDILLEKLPPIDIGNPVQITGQAGDVILCHYQVAHGVAPNQSPNTRYALYYRLKHIQHDAVWKETYKNIWMHYPGIRELLNES